MSNFHLMLRAEISRLARKEARALVDPLRKQVSMLRRESAAQRAIRSTLERRVKELERLVKRSRITDATPIERDVKYRFSAPRLKANRERLGLSAADLGVLLGCSGQSVYQWESGATRPRPAQLARIGAVRTMGKREARSRLAVLRNETAGSRK